MSGHLDRALCQTQLTGDHPIRRGLVLAQQSPRPWGQTEFRHAADPLTRRLTATAWQTLPTMVI